MASQANNMDAWPTPSIWRHASYNLNIHISGLECAVPFQGKIVNSAPSWLPIILQQILLNAVCVFADHWLCLAVYLHTTFLFFFRFRSVLLQIRDKMQLLFILIILRDDKRELHTLSHRVTHFFSTGSDFIQTQKFQVHCKKCHYFQCY